MTRHPNFSAGPAKIPDEVLQQAQLELMDFADTGMSVMEVSHRSPGFIAIAEQAVSDFRSLMAIPDNYSVLYMQGGATHQFSCVPWNLLGKSKKADYIDTGVWSQKAIKEASRLESSDIHIAGSVNETGLLAVPRNSDLSIRSDSTYLHYTPNETISGLEFSYIPETGDVPLVADMSSCILSQQYDVSKFGIIYAGAQKNIGPAGITWVIIRNDLLDQAVEHIPALMNYRSVIGQDSMLNTPPTYALYLSGLVFKWLKKQGGVAEIEKVNLQKAKLIYEVIDQGEFYMNTIEPSDRSKMNVTFSLANQSLDAKFIEESEKLGLYNLKGHRVVGGMRASIYNASSLESVQALSTFMNDFAKRYG